MILVGIAGPHLTVTGAIFGDRVTTQRLTDYIYLGPHPSREGRAGLDEGIYQVACVLRALEVSTGLLREHYLGLNLEAGRVDGELMPPYVREFTADGKTYKLKYTKRMAASDPDKVVFEAFVEPMSQAGESGVVVVKFAHSYCGAAHRLLAEKSLAPRLRYCEKVESIGMYVVVMDLVIGGGVREPRQDRWFTDKLQAAIKTLHDANFVHGDLRGPNILITEDDDTKVHKWDASVARGGLIKTPWKHAGSYAISSVLGSWGPYPAVTYLRYSPPNTRQ